MEPEPSVQRKMLDLKYQSGTLYQIPVYQARFDEYGTYTVTITVSNAGDGTNFYLDGIRIYNPIDPNGADAEEAQDQYRTDREAKCGDYRAEKYPSGCGKL